jgi:hypothetical protein
MPAGSRTPVPRRVLLSDQKQKRQSVGKADRLGQLTRCRLSGEKVPALD